MPLGTVGICKEDRLRPCPVAVSRRATAQAPMGRNQYGSKHGNHATRNHPASIVAAYLLERDRQLVLPSRHLSRPSFEIVANP
jgi:hypothetical protein